MQRNDHLVPVIKSLRLASHKSLSAYSVLPNNRVSLTASFAQVYFTPSSIQLTENGDNDNAGKMYNYMLQFFFPGKNTDANRLKFQKYLNEMALVEITYSDNTKELMGNDKVGALFFSDYDKRRGGYQVNCSFIDSQPLATIV
jgi:hypothetical protein